MREGNLANQSDGRRQQNSSKFTIFSKKITFLKVYMQLLHRKLHFSGKKGPCGHAHTQTKVVDTKNTFFQQKKSPCGHVHTQNKGCEYQKLHFSPKKGPCGHAHTQTQVVNTTN